MPIDPSIALGVRPPQIESPMNVLAQSMQLQNAQSGNALNMLKLQETKRGLDADASLRQALSAPDADPYQALLRNGKVKEATDFAKGQSEIAHQKSQMKQADATTAKTELESTFQKFAHAGSVLSQVKDPTSYATARQMLNSQLGMNLPEQYDPGLVQATIAQGQTVTERLKAEHERLTLAETSRHNVSSEGLTARGQDVTVRGQDLVDKRAGETLNMHYAVAGMNPDGTPKQMPVAADGSIDLTKIAPEDLAAAHRYRADGTLPPNMGRGAQGAMESKRIRAIATALDSQAGESPEDARIRQLALKGDVNAVAAMRKREVAVGANVKNFDFNADQVLELSHKVDRTGVPIINAWVNAGRRSVTGNPELAAFDTAVKTTVNEFAQIVSGTTSGASTEGEKKKAEALLNAQQTPEQIISVINQMRIESKNRMQSFANQRRESMPTNGPRPVPAAAPAAGVAVPADIKAILDKHGGKS